MTHYFDDLSTIVKVVLLVVAGSIISPVYRILRYLETKNQTTLIAGVVSFIPGLGFAVGILDALCVYSKGKIVLFAD